MKKLYDKNIRIINKKINLVENKSSNTEVVASMTDSLELGWDKRSIRPDNIKVKANIRTMQYINFIIYPFLTMHFFILKRRLKSR